MSQRPPLLKRFLVLGSVILLAGCSLFFFDRMVFEKLATRLVLPCGLLWLTLLGASIILIWCRQRFAAAIMLLMWLCFSVIGSPIAAGHLILALEDPYTTIDPLALEPFDAVIVLGGGSGTGANGRIQGNGSGDRLILTAQMYHAGLAKTIICTGQRIPSLGNPGLDPADEGRLTLIALGVPEDRIAILPGRNTSEEMSALGDRFDSTQRVGLVTSAWHLRRAMALAERNGFSPTPLPADFRTGPADSPRTWGFYLLAVIPDQDALTNSSCAIKEHLGRLVGR